MFELPLRGVYLALGLLVSGLFAAVPSTGRAETPGNTAEVSTADNQWLLWLPMDSKTSIDDAFEVFARDYNVDRVWWRGGQDEFWLKYHTFRKSNRFYYEMWGWIRHLIEVAGTNKAAIAAARNHEMEIWLESGLFEFTCHADAGACIVYPYQSEDTLRSEHPEWIPVNKYGTRTQSGPIEFAYPEARKAYRDRLVSFLVEHDYDGIVFYTYVENFTYRYLDEFGYNEPIAQEFKKRYGVDIRTEAFDKEAWAKVRGEYVTEFLRELSAALKPHGIKIAMRLNPGDGQSHMPEIWAASQKGPISTAGRIHMDWETWAKEGIVDELCIYWPGNDATLKEVTAAVKGTGTAISMYRTQGEMPDDVRRCLFPAEEIGSGFPRDHFIGWENEQLPQQSLEMLKGDDKFARRRVLYMITRGKQPDADRAFELVAAATKDPDLYVRRLAVDALAVLKDPRAIPVLEAALRDPENSVRCKAAVALGALNSTASIDRIFDAVRETSTLQFTYVAAKGTLNTLGASDPGPLIQRVTDPDVNVRRLAVQCLANRDTPEVRSALIKAAGDDEDPYVRELAIGSLALLKVDPEITAAVTRGMSDPDETVQVRAATYLATAIPQAPLPPPADGEPKPEWRLDQPTRFGLFPADTPEGKAQRDALTQLLAFFRQYGDGGKRGDADWGWRVVGNSILCFGAEGEAELKKLIADTSNRRLAENAWQVVYVRQQPMGYVFVTEEQDALAHQQHPFLGK